MNRDLADAARQAEALRQQRMLQVLWRRLPEQALGAELRGSPLQQARGWAAYAANAAASADRVLAGVYPALARCLGGQAMAVLARQAWRQAPPEQGDLEAWEALAEAVPRLLAQAPPLAGQPWLPDLARLEWRVHQAERAADAAAGPPAGLELLGGDGGPACRLQLRPGTALLCSAWPVATRWAALQAEAAPTQPGPQPDTEPWPEAAPEAALVLRQGWRATVQPLAPADAAFTGAVLAGTSLAEALDAALAASGAAAWSFEPWLLHALRQGWITAVLA